MINVSIVYDNGSIDQITNISPTMNIYRGKKTIAITFAYGNKVRTVDFRNTESNVLMTNRINEYLFNVPNFQIVVIDNIGIYVTSSDNFTNAVNEALALKGEMVNE